MNILLIEDDEIKGGQLHDFIAQAYPHATLRWERSFSSGLRSIVSAETFDALILDMSLPDNDLGEMDGSGEETFAGRDLLSQMKFRGVSIPTIVVTMFDNFGKGESRVSLEELGASLIRQFSPMLRGVVYYSIAKEGWRASLKKYLDALKGEL
ncbi:MULTISPECIES: hypothetical protein [Stenotrophomonas]|uniref:hypothetical protein n=1 Tax=Stenotrophomonas TaxID=40323 RepID=UPI000B66810E|nr:MULTISPECIES: hypothetical protein [Stenotrophomonas]SMR82778.1 hypothetical protein SAMN04487863_3499 [Stenotrophomonas sp. yr243]SNT46874.1 hypothetical protein SAMN05518671_2116 [Stenotrophomonas lactitubi]